MFIEIPAQFKTLPYDAKEWETLALYLIVTWPEKYQMKNDVLEELAKTTADYSTAALVYAIGDFMQLAREWREAAQMLSKQKSKEFYG